MWLFLWILFVLCAVGFFLWSYHTIYEQKKAWKVYANKMGMTYVPGNFLQSPEMTGFVKDHQVNFYPDIVENGQGQRSTQNVVEVFLNRVPDVSFIVSSEGFSDYLTAFDLPEGFAVENHDWPKKAIGRTLSNEPAAKWFAADRQRIIAVQDLFKLPFDVGIVADGEKAFVVIRTANPLTEPRKLNQLVNKLIAISEMLQAEGAVAPQPTMANPNEDKNTVEPETSDPKE